MPEDSPQLLLTVEAIARLVTMIQKATELLEPAEPHPFPLLVECGEVGYLGITQGYLLKVWVQLIPNRTFLSDTYHNLFGISYIPLTLVTYHGASTTR